jgi:Holliday junction resolvase
MPKRVDANQREVVDALRKFGCTVQCLHMVGKGCPDLLVGYQGMNILIEVKVGDAKQTQAEKEWSETWKGDYSIARTPGHAIEIVRLAVIYRYLDALQERR